MIYYKLTNYYQNHRTYGESRDDAQLHGDANAYLDSHCEPLRYGGPDKLPYAPCGLIANSLFNDSFELEWSSQGSWKPAFLSQVDIAWSTDRTRRFGKPPANSWLNSLKPVNWKEAAIVRNKGAYADDEPLLVWMSLPAYSTFQKPYARIEKVANYTNQLPEGSYRLLINYSYPVTQFEGTKSFVIINFSWMGGRNNALPNLFFISATVLLLLTIFFTVLHLMEKKSNSYQPIRTEEDYHDLCEKIDDS